MIDRNMPPYVKPIEFFRVGSSLIKISEIACVELNMGEGCISCTPSIVMKNGYICKFGVVTPNSKIMKQLISLTDLLNCNEKVIPTYAVDSIISESSDDSDLPF